jgi:hypothetical protein
VLNLKTTALSLVISLKLYVRLPRKVVDINTLDDSSKGDAE